MVNGSDKFIKQLINETAMLFPEIPENSTPPEIGAVIHQNATRMTGIEDPYRQTKIENIKEALKLYPEMKKIVSDAEDPLLAAVKIAIAGNIIDFGTGHDFDILEDIKRISVQDLSVNHFKEFKKEMDSAETVLYIGDNAGETVFDKVLIEQINAKVIYSVRSRPILNDATEKEAVESGLGRVSEIIDSGSTAPGTLLSMCTDEFLDIFKKADVVISKGQGNYESLSGVQRPVYFMLMAKCEIVARDLNVNVGDTILKRIHLD